MQILTPSFDHAQAVLWIMDCLSHILPMVVSRQFHRKILLAIIRIIMPHHFPTGIRCPHSFKLRHWPGAQVVEPWSHSAAMSWPALSQPVSDERNRPSLPSTPARNETSPSIPNVVWQPPKMKRARGLAAGWPSLKRHESWIRLLAASALSGRNFFRLIHRGSVQHL